MAPRETLTNVDDADLTSLALIQAMRATSDNLKLLTGGIADLRADLKEEHKSLEDVRERLIRMEASSLTSQVVELRKDVDDLMATHREQVGAVKLADWLRLFGPWILALGAAAYAVVKG